MFQYSYIHYLNLKCSLLIIIYLLTFDNDDEEEDKKCQQPRADLR